MEPTMYQICVQGRLTERLASALEGMTLHGGAVNTVFTDEKRSIMRVTGVQPETAAGGDNPPGPD